MKILNNFRYLFTLVVLPLVLVNPTFVFADTIISPSNSTPCEAYFKVFVSNMMPIADGNDYASLGFNFVQNPAAEGGCIGGGVPITAIKIAVSGTGNTLSSSIAIASNPEGTAFQPITLKSTIGGVKTITIYANWADMGFDQENPYAGGSITFKEASASIQPKPTVTNNTQPVVQPKTSVATTTPQTPPVTPQLTELKIEDNLYNPNERKTFVLSKPVVFSGKTIPNGVVRLYFQSDPFEDTATADVEGNWTYTLTKNIGLGGHQLQVAVTDPVTKLTSEKSEVAKFSLMEPVTQNMFPKESSQPFPWLYLGCGVLLLLTLGGLGLYLWKRKTIKKTASETLKPLELDSDQK